jgi:hypothetical protein
VDRRAVVPTDCILEAMAPASMGLATSTLAVADDRHCSPPRPTIMHPARQLTNGRDLRALASLARRSENLASVLEDAAREATGRPRWK